MVAMQVALCIYNGPSFADVFEPDATGLNAAFKTMTNWLLQNRKTLNNYMQPVLLCLCSLLLLPLAHPGLVGRWRG